MTFLVSAFFIVKFLFYLKCSLFSALCSTLALFSGVLLRLFLLVYSFHVNLSLIISFLFGKCLEQMILHITLWTAQPNPMDGHQMASAWANCVKRTRLDSNLWHNWPCIILFSQGGSEQEIGPLLCPQMGLDNKEPRLCRDLAGLKWVVKERSLILGPRLEIKWGSENDRGRKWGGASWN